MTAVALNNLWTYIEGLSLKQKDREWLASKLLEPKADDAKAAKREGRKLQTVDEFIKELRMEEETV